MGFQDWLTDRMFKYDGEMEEEEEGEDEPIVREERKTNYRKRKTDIREEEVDEDQTENMEGPRIVHSFKKNQRGVRESEMEEMKEPEVRIFIPTAYDEAKEIVEALQNNVCIVLNLEDLDLDLAVRILDFTIGACYAMGGSMQKISTRIFVVTPHAVKLSGEDLRAFGNNTDFSSLDLDM